MDGMVTIYENKILEKNWQEGNYMKCLEHAEPTCQQ